MIVQGKAGLNTVSEKRYNACPYCGSSNISIDVDVRVTCHIENDKICLDDPYLNPDVFRSEICDVNDIGGYCNDCEKYFDIDFDTTKGVYCVKIDTLRRMEKKYCINKS